MFCMGKSTHHHDVPGDPGDDAEVDGDDSGHDAKRIQGLCS